jgi:hypothetical protein
MDLETHCVEAIGETNLSKINEVLTLL